MKLEKPKKVLITGANGFLGKEVSKELQKRNYQVTATDIHDYSFLDTPINYYGLDLSRDISGIQNLISEVDIVLHFASIVGAQTQNCDPMEVFSINVGASAKIVEMTMNMSKRLMFSSTSEIYGLNPKIPWQEDSHRVFGEVNDSKWNYGLGKTLIEQLIIDLSKRTNFEFSILRLFNLYGIGQPKWNFISRSISLAKENLPVEVVGTGHMRYSFTYIEDVALAICELIELDHHGIINIGNPKNYSLNEVCEILIDFFPTMKIQYVNNPLLGSQSSLTSSPSLVEFERYLPNFQFTSLAIGIEKILSNA